MSIQEEYFGNTFMSACHIRNRDEYLFIAHEPKEFPDPFERTEFIYVTYIKGQWKRHKAARTLDLFGGFVSLPGMSWILVTFFGDVLRIDENGREWEKQIPVLPEYDQVIISGVNVIDGRLYTVSDWRMVRRRDGSNKWTRLSNGLPSIDDIDEDIDQGFSVIDGFSENDIYAAGDNGDLWHWDGHIWKQIEIPTNADIEGICCGGDGVVYLNTDASTFVVGKGGRWKTIQHDLENEFRNMVWFRDRVYMGAGDKLYEIKDGGFRESGLNKSKSKPVDVSFIDANEEVMLMGSKLEVAAYDGNQFNTIIPFMFGGG